MAAAVSSTILVSSVAHTAETTTFTYDALGRLTKSSHSDGPRAGTADPTNYDPAGNRTASSIAASLPNNAVLSISASPGVNEGQPAIFTITKTGNASGTVTVNYATANASAVAPGDYTATTGQLSFPTSTTVLVVSVPTHEDGLAEGAQTFTMTLSSPSGATLGTSSSTATINPSVAPNQKPVANWDSASGFVCTGGVTVDVVANDTDPDGNYPLSVVSVATNSAMSVSVSGTKSVHANNSSGATGPMDAIYTVRDSLGATATGTLTVNWGDNGGCN